MSTVFRRNRKNSDEAIVRMNALGLSLTKIAEELKCHPTSITLRLKSLNIPPADTRRAFMEDIYTSMPAEFREELADFLMSEGSLSIKEYVKLLMIRDMEARRASTPAVSLLAAAG